MNPSTVAMVSLGCAKNQVSAEQMLYRLKEAGCTIKTQLEGVDAVVVNTCGFIESAKREAIEQILELAALKQEGKIKKIIVTGCLAERYKEEILSELPETDGLVGCGSFHDIVKALDSSLAGETPVLFAPPAETPLDTPRVLSTPSYTAYLKVAEGCDNCCAYCVIPGLRGAFRSRPMEALVQEAEALVAGGVKEIILIAQDTSRYGLDLYGERRLSALLTALCGIEGLQWLRLHYLYPDEIDDQLIETMACQDKIVKYLDIPIQHASDRMLSAMGRRGTCAELEALFGKLRARMPDVVLRTSVIVGLPGETEEDFEQLCAFLRNQCIERAGVFPYSPEEGTPAAAMPDQVDEETKARRADVVLGIQQGIMEAFNESLQGRILTVLVEGFDRYAGYHFGRSWADSPEVDGKVFFTARQRVPEGAFVRVRITGIVDGDPFGKARGH